MKKDPIIVSAQELEIILLNYIESGANLNYAIKILGHPGIGKSAIVKQAAFKKNFYFIDTRLAFKENIDLGGYPVPDHEKKLMIYYRPKFIPPVLVPENYDGILWFLDESNRAHPTVIQTLFQIITERKCGEHELPQNTVIVLAGNLGESDNTTITEFDDSALDGRLAIFHLKPTTQDWINWALQSEIHQSIINYISFFPEKLWDEQNINPNPRGWHQVSLTLTKSFKLNTEEEFLTYLNQNDRNLLEKIINSLLGIIVGNDFIMQFTSPREISTQDVLQGDLEKIKSLKEEKIPSEDLLWALSGAINYFRDLNVMRKGNFFEHELKEIGNFLIFIGFSRSDMRMSFFYMLIKTSGIFSQIPSAIKTIIDKNAQLELFQKFELLLEEDLY